MLAIAVRTENGSHFTFNLAAKLWFIVFYKDGQNYQLHSHFTPPLSSSPQDTSNKHDFTISNSSKSYCFMWERFTKVGLLNIIKLNEVVFDNLGLKTFYRILYSMKMIVVTRGFRTLLEVIYCPSLFKCSVAYLWFAIPFNLCVYCAVVVYFSVSDYQYLDCIHISTVYTMILTLLYIIYYLL